MENETINHEFNIWNIWCIDNKFMVDFVISTADFPKEVVNSMKNTLIREDCEDDLLYLEEAYLFLEKDENGQYFGSNGSFELVDDFFDNVPNTKFPLYFLTNTSEVIAIPYELDEDFLNKLKVVYEKSVEFFKERVELLDDGEYKEECLNFGNNDFSELEGKNNYIFDDMEKE